MYIYVCNDSLHESNKIRYELVTLRYVPDICQLLLKYNIQGIINNLLLPGSCIVSKKQLKTLLWF